MGIVFGGGVVRATAADVRCDDAELLRSQATAARIDREWPLDRLGPVAKLVTEIGARLGEGVGKAPYPWRFTVIRDRSLNAFSIGGGRIYVTDGAIRECGDEAELAALLAHEMGHELAGDFREPAARNPEGLFSMWTLFGNGGGRTPDVHIGSLSQTIDPLREREADRLSLGILRAAGYDPYAALRVVQRRSNDRTGSAADHAQRTADLRVLLSDIPSGGRTDGAEFQMLRRRTLGDTR